MTAPLRWCTSVIWLNTADIIWWGIVFLSAKIRKPKTRFGACQVQWDIRGFWHSLKQIRKSTKFMQKSPYHYNDVIMSAMASQTTSHNRLFRHRWKKTSKLSVTGLCEGNSPVTGEFPAQRASNAENVFIWWRHHVVRPLWGFVLLSCRSMLPKFFMVTAPVPAH